MVDEDALLPLTYGLYELLREWMEINIDIYTDIDLACVKKYVPSSYDFQSKLESYWSPQTCGGCKSSSCNNQMKP